jgi:type IV pilus biogenesis protein PilP
MTTTPASLPSNDDQEEDQKKYLGKVDELQTLKLQRQIAETNQAIAAARLATVTAEKGITDLLTSSKSQPANVPQIVYSNQLENPSNVPSSLPAVTPTPAPAEPEVEYSVISVAMQLHQWSAILGYQGKLYNVTVGDTLPPDNSKVTQITSSHVTLRKDGKSRKVSVLSSI